MSDLISAESQDVSRLFEPSGDSWAIVDQMCAGSLYRTHYFCRACCADLTDLRVHHVRWCPYCGIEMSFLLDGLERDHGAFDGGLWMSWPYEALSARFVDWCSWHGSGDEPKILTEDGGWSQTLSSCRLLEGHDGPHEFTKGRIRPPTNPVRGKS